MWRLGLRVARCGQGSGMTHTCELKEPHIRDEGSEFLSRVQCFELQGSGLQFFNT